MPMPVEWYRTPGHDLPSKSEFDRRYARARRPHRVQYKVIKAIHLLEAGEPGAIHWAQQLLTEVTVDQDAYRHDKWRAFETLAGIHRGSGQWELAVQALEQAIKITGPGMSEPPACQTSPWRKSCWRTTPAACPSVLTSSTRNRSRAGSGSTPTCSATISRQRGHDNGSARIPARQHGVH